MLLQGCALLALRAGLGGVLGFRVAWCVIERNRYVSRVCNCGRV